MLFRPKFFEAQICYKKPNDDGSIFKRNTGLIDVGIYFLIEFLNLEILIPKTYHVIDLSQTTAKDRFLDN